MPGNGGNGLPGNKKTFQNPAVAQQAVVNVAYIPVPFTV